MPRSSENRGKSLGLQSWVPNYLLSINLGLGLGMQSRVLFGVLFEQLEVLFGVGVRKEVFACNFEKIQNEYYSFSFFKVNKRLINR